MNSINVYHQLFFSVHFFLIQVKCTQSRASWTHVNQFKTYTPMHDTAQKCSKVIIRSATQRKQNPTHSKTVPNHFFQRKRKWKQKRADSSVFGVWMGSRSDIIFFKLTWHSRTYFVCIGGIRSIQFGLVCVNRASHSLTNLIVHHWEELATISYND